MAESRFVYVTYIRTTPEKLWQALLDPEFTRQFWVGTWQECAWKVGASWKLMIPDGRVGDSGEVLEFDPPRRLVLSWRNEFKPELHEEGFSRMTYTLEPQKPARNRRVARRDPHLAERDVKRKKRGQRPGEAAGPVDRSGDGSRGMQSGPGGRPELFVVNIRSTARANRGTGTARMAQLKPGKGTPSEKAEPDDFETPRNQCNFYRWCG